MRHKKQRSGVVAGIMLPMGLICLFAFCSLALALLGGRAYKAIQGEVDRSHGGSVAASYLRTKLGQAGGANEVALREMEGTQVLVLATEIQDTPYETRIFLHDGMLTETFGAASSRLEPLGGNAIAPVASCSFAIDEAGLFTAEFTGQPKDEGGEGDRTQMAYALAGGGRL